MTTALALAALLFVQAPPAPPSPEVTITGATAEQEAVVYDVLSWPELPPLKQTLSVSFWQPGTGGAIAVAGPSFITLAPGLTGTSLRDVFLHEYGHVWDWQYLFQEDRAFIMDCDDDDNCSTINPNRYGWQAGAYVGGRPIEQWANSFRDVVLFRHANSIPAGSWPVAGMPRTELPVKLVGHMIDFRTSTPCDHSVSTIECAVG